ncbi:HmuY family protein [Comamonas endophytica]|uniref:HmuY family protein n=1 Tax=Comamonas endophytica TaxID=2949090 RepID=A0ABY6GAN3_9BURK|nr:MULTISPECIES: HmuY family protein [unclassified Acidovorax]MCD2513896.1 HmuY family protein [Acidovorax sp. D4N7]UYG52108.1 HmuY family protein [Acidovorax sp. 5MLIR]
MIHAPSLTFGKTALAMAVAVVLTACGGGGGGDDAASDPTAPVTPAPTPTPTPTPEPTPVGFTQSAQWNVALPASGASVCYDFNAKAEVPDCSGTAWDLKIKSAGMTATFWTNSGTSGSGQGGAFGGPLTQTWTQLKTWANATTDPTAGPLPATVYAKDSASGVFTGSNSIASAAFEYGVGGSTDHRLYPNYRTFLITTDSASASTAGTVTAPVFALQVTGYYGGAGGTTSGYPSFRWVDRSAPAVVRSASVNASGADWVYFDLAAGAVSSATGTWHIAFNRYNFKLNGGESGSGTVAGFLAKTPAGFYDAQGKPVAAQFTNAANLAATQADLGASDLAVPARAANWVKDATTSPLQPNPAYTGTYPNPLNYGWFTYHPTVAASTAAGLPAVAHLIKANSESASLLRGGEGNTYARFHLSNIAYANPSVATSQQTWTIDFDVQPQP